MSGDAQGDGLRLLSLHVYPVKGCRGASPPAACARARGLAGDRRWMIVDAQGRFVSQRTRPRLAMIEAQVGSGALALTTPGLPPLRVPLDAGGGPRGGSAREVVVWDDRVAATDAGDGAAAWLQAVVGEATRLVHMPETARRPVDPRFGLPGDVVGFADAYPYLLIGASSLADLNARLPRPLPMDRFRPNLVVGGAPPYAEDGWRRIRVGGVTFRVVKPCTRCAVTTVDQATGEPDGPEPLRTLGAYRRWPDGLRFGMNLVADDEGELRVGAPVTIVG